MQIRESGGLVLNQNNTKPSITTFPTRLNQRGIQEALKASYLLPTLFQITAKKAPLHYDSVVVAGFYLINIDEMLKYLLTQRDKSGWCSSLMDGPGAQAAPHISTAVQSRKSMESRRKCASTVKTYTPPVAVSLQSSKLCWNTGTLSI